jgi:hypothetical protein
MTADVKREDGIDSLLCGVVVAMVGNVTVVGRSEADP